MAESLYHGLIEIDVVDGGAPAKLSAIIAQIQAEMAKLGRVGGVSIGGGALAGLETGAEATMAAVAQLRAQLAELARTPLGAAAASSAGKEGLSSQVRETQALQAATQVTIGKLEALHVVQIETQVDAFKSAAALAEQAAVAARPVQPRLASGRFANAEQLAVEAEATRVAQESRAIVAQGSTWSKVAGAPSSVTSGPDATSGVHLVEAAQKEEAQARIEAARGARLETDRLEEAASKLVVAQSNYARVITSETGETEASIGRIASANAKHIAAMNHLATVEDEVALRTADRSKIDANTSGIRQRNQLDLAIAEAKAKILTTENGVYRTGLEIERAQVDVVVAAERLAATIGREAEVANRQAQAASGLKVNTVARSTVPIASLEAEVAARAAAAQGVIAESDLVRRAGLKVVQAKSNLATVVEQEAGTTEAGIAKLAAAQGSVITAENTLAKAQEKAALLATDLSKVSPVASARVQRAQTEVALAESNFKTLSASQAGYRSEVEINAARIRVLEATGRLAAIQEKEAAAVAGSSSGGFGALSALKYFALYQALSMAEKAVRGMVEHTGQYSLAVNQLALALGTTTAAVQEKANGYAAAGSALATPPAVAVNAAAIYTRFWQDKSGLAGDVGAQLGSTINLLEAKSARDGEEEALVKKRLDDLGAIGQNFELGPQGTKDLYGSATYIGQHYGQQMPGDILAGAAQISDLTKQTGFTAEQTVAMVAAVSQRSGQTGEASAGDLKRILAKAGSGTFNALFGEYGIDASPVKPGGQSGIIAELTKLAHIFDKLPQGGAEQTNIISTLGGPRAGGALLNMIENLPELLDTAQKGKEHPETADLQAGRELATFAGELKTIRNDILTLTNDLSKTGLGGALGLLLVGADQTVKALDALIKGLNSLPGAASGAIAAAALVAVAWKAPGATAAVTGALNRVSGFGVLGATAAPVAASAASTEAATALAAAQLRVAETSNLYTAASNRAGLVMADLTATTADMAAVQADATAAVSAHLKAQADLIVVEAAAADVAVTDAAAQGELAVVEGTGVVAGLGALAGAAAGAAVALGPLVAAIAIFMRIGDMNANKDLAHSATDWVGYGTTRAEEGIKGENLDILDAGISAMKNAQEKKKKAEASNESLIGPDANYDVRTGKSSTDPDQMTPAQRASIAEDKKLAEELAKAVAFRKSLEEKRVALSGQSKPVDFFGPDYTNVTSGLDQLGTNRLSTRDASVKMLDLLKHTKSAALLSNELTPASDQTGFDKEFDRQITAIGKEGNPRSQEKDLGRLQAVALASSAAAKVDGRASVIGGAQDLLDKINQPLYQTVVKNVNDNVASIKAFEGNSAKAKRDIEAAIKGGLTKTASGGSVTSTIAMIQVFSTQELKAFNSMVAQKRQILEGEMATLRALVDAAAADLAASAPSDPGAADHFTRMQYASGNGPKSAAQIANEKLLKAKQNQDAALKTEQATIATATPYAAPSGSAIADSKTPKTPGPTPAQIEEARLAAQAVPGDPVSAALANMRVAEYKMSEPKNKVEYWTALKNLNDAKYAYAQAQQSGAEAQVAAGEISGDPLSAAAANLTIARMKLASAVGSAAYYTALKGLHDAQYASAQAQLANANDAEQLMLDLTNPLVVARQKVREAQRLLAFDSGRGANTTKDRLALKQDQSAAEKTAFDQQFSDQQTNYNLQRESLSAYLSYLNAQHNYLSHVKVKTRQQVDELNQVDQALKSLADSMQGQFNLGSIKVPTAYEARRIQASGGDTHSNVQITINGADIAAVKGIIAQYVGQGAMATAGTAVRKV